MTIFSSFSLCYLHRISTDIHFLLLLAADPVLNVENPRQTTQNPAKNVSIHLQKLTENMDHELMEFNA